MSTDLEQQIAADVKESIAVKQAFFSSHTAQIVQAAEACTKALQNGHKLLFAGNGGSAADAQHLAAEFTGRYLIDRDPVPAIALTTNSSSVTAIGNDYGYELVFERQLRAFGQAGDVLFAISTSGNSENVIRATIEARKRQITVIGLLGGEGGKLREHVDIALIAPAQRPDRVQETHITVGHIICGIVERALFG